jgi:hypothetical protein
MTERIDVTRTSTTSGTSNRTALAPVMASVHTMLTSNDGGDVVLAVTVRPTGGGLVEFVVTDPDLAARFAGQMVDGSVRLRAAQEMT